MVLRRYETTIALPVEYGALNVGSVCTGLLFYAERDSMDTWQVRRWDMRVDGW